MAKCWLCEKEITTAECYPTIFGPECLECGPPQPMGPTEAERETEPRLKAWLEHADG